MNVLSNQNEKGYEKIIQMENFNRVGRKIAWIGAQMKKRSKWYWIDYKTPEWYENIHIGLQKNGIFGS